MRVIVTAAFLGFAAPALAQSDGCDAGRVLAVSGDVVTICAGPAPVAIGDRVAARRLEPVAGPSRHPFFVPRQVAQLRLDRAEGDRVEAAVIWGKVRPGDRVALD